MDRGRSPGGATSVGKSRLRLSIGRHPYDLARLVVAGALLAAGALLSLVPANPVELAVFWQLRSIPAASDPLWIALSWLGSWVGIGAVAATALYLKWIRVGLTCAAAGAASWVAAQAMHWVLGGRPLPPVLPPQGDYSFPSAEVAIVAALAVVVTPYLGRRARHVGWILAVLVGAGGVHLAHYLPLGALGGGLLGWGVGTLFHLVWGAPGRRISEEGVRRELEVAGFEPVSLLALRYRLLEPRQFAVRTRAGETLRVKVVRRLHRRAGVWYKLRRLLAAREVPDEVRVSTAHHEVEHEAYVGLLAERAGVRTSPVVLAFAAKHAPPLLVHRHVEGRRFTELRAEEVDDELLTAIWQQVALLSAAGIAHHDLRAKNVLVDHDRRPWLLNFTFAQPGADAARRSQDVAEALISVASVAGIDRTVSAAIGALPAEQLRLALVNLHALALPRRIRVQTDTGRYLFADLRETVADAIESPIPTFRSPVRPMTVVGLLLVGVAVYTLMPQLSSMRDVLDALRGANWWWLAVAAVTGFVAILMSSISMHGCSRVRLPFWSTLAVQVAAAFTGRTTPGGVGFFGINVVYMEQLGLRRSLAVGVTMLNQAGTGAVAFVLGVVGIFGVGMTGMLGDLSIPTGWPVLLGVVVGLLLLGVVLGSPFGRRRILHPSLEVARELLETLHHPVRAVQLCGGAVGYLLVSGYGLVASLAAFTPDYSVVAVVTVFVVANTVGHLAPAPGGLGAVEAAMIAGLGAVGIPATAAVTAVLTSRLLTYWLQVLPGVAMFRYLQHREII